MKRDQGYYWVQFKESTEWIVAFWHERKGGWQIINAAQSKYGDSWFSQIGHKIPSNDDLTQMHSIIAAYHNQEEQGDNY